MQTASGCHIGACRAGCDRKAPAGAEYDAVFGADAASGMLTGAAIGVAGDDSAVSACTAAAGAPSCATAGAAAATE